MSTSMGMGIGHKGTAGRTAAGRAAWLVVMLLALQGGTARADCLDSDFTAPPPAVAKVGGTDPRVFFVRGAEGGPECPAETPACRAASFVVPGDVVLVAGQEGRFACVAFANAKGVNTLGLLPAATLSPVTDAPDGPGHEESWLGTWSRIEATIAIKPAASGALTVHGDATWGGEDPVRVRNGGVHTGEVGGTASPDAAGVLEFADGDKATLPYNPADKMLCSIRMLRRGPYLVVSDNMACGGLNVSFAGLYRRR